MSLKYYSALTVFHSFPALIMQVLKINTCSQVNFTTGALTAPSCPSSHPLSNWSLTIHGLGWRKRAVGRSDLPLKQVCVWKGGLGIALAMLLPHRKKNTLKELKMGEELTAAKQKLYLDCIFHSACNDLNCLLVKYTSSLGVSGCGCWNTLSVTGARWVMYYKLHKQNVTLKTLRWDYSIYMHFRNLSAIIEYSLVSELRCMLVHACTNMFFKYWMISRNLKNRNKCKYP